MVSTGQAKSTVRATEPASRKPRLLLNTISASRINEPVAAVLGIQIAEIAHPIQRRVPIVTLRLKCAKFRSMLANVGYNRVQATGDR